MLFIRSALCSCLSIPTDGTFRAFPLDQEAVFTDHDFSMPLIDTVLSERIPSLLDEMYLTSV
jgi:hypothetical protein